MHRQALTLVALCLGVVAGSGDAVGQSTQPARQGCPELVAYLNECRETFCPTHAMPDDCAFMFTGLLEQARRIPSACTPGLAETRGLSCAEFALRAFTEAQRRHAQVDLQRLRDALTVYQVTRGGELPATLEALAEGTEDNPPVIARVPLDPWGRAYVYTVSESGQVELYSAGSDGQAGTDDDLRAESP